MIIAANTANCIRGSTRHVADSPMQCPNRVLGRARQFEEGGSLWGPPKSARPAGINRAAINEILEAVSTYYRTARFNLELFKHTNRKIELACTNSGL